jgi:glycosyltransferase involved in cell wall biosynthesis
MHVGIDCSCVAKPHRTGVARYCISLVRAMPAALEEEDTATLLYRVSRWRRRDWFERVDDPRFAVGVFHDRVVPFGGGKFDVVHGPDLRIPRFRRVPAVSTVHDLSALDVPGIADARFRAGKTAALAEVAAAAAVIICISRFTESAFLARHPEAQGRTRIVPLGLSGAFQPVDPDSADVALAARGVKRPYLLFVGQVAARKNLGVLLAAFRELRRRRRDLRLVLAGPVQTGGDEVVAAARASPDAGAIDFLGYVGDDLLPALYARAEAFVFPGRGEGFGIPILESMACGTPVVVAKAGANEETGGDAVLAADPDSAAEFEAALTRLLDDSALRTTLVERGRARASRFTWSESARLTVQAYRDAARIGVSA